MKGANQNSKGKQAIYQKRGKKSHSEQVAIDFIFASDWLRKRSEFFRPIPDGKVAKPIGLLSTLSGNVSFNTH